MKFKITIVRIDFRIAIITIFSIRTEHVGFPRCSVNKEMRICDTLRHFSIKFLIKINFYYFLFFMYKLHSYIIYYFYYFTIRMHKLHSYIIYYLLLLFVIPFIFVVQSTKRVSYHCEIPDRKSHVLD
jgi:hypothetical protein